MTKMFAVFFSTMLCAGAALAAQQCQGIGWRLVDQKLISNAERLCVYEKNGTRVSIIVSTFCPAHPC